MRVEVKSIYCAYDFFITLGNEEIKVASLRGQIVGLDKAFLDMHFPTQSYTGMFYNCVRLEISYLCRSFGTI